MFGIVDISSGSDGVLVSGYMLFSWVLMMFPVWMLLSLGSFTIPLDQRL